MNAKRLLDRLFPARLQERVALDNDALRELFSRVYPEDPCLRAVEELLGRQLLESATTAGNLNVPAEIKLRACERMECARVLLLLIEEHREQAKAWRDEQEKIKR